MPTAHPGRERGDSPVLVVGGGPTGLTAALLLARYGVPTLVVERHVEPYPLPRAVHLDDEAVRVLQAVGLAEAFRDLSRPAPGLRLVDARGRPMALFGRGPSGRHGHPESNLFDQPALDRLLLAAAQAEPLCTVLLATECLDLRLTDAGPVLVRLRDGRSGAAREVSADLVLGCDGADSLARSAVGARLDDLGFAERWAVLDVRSTDPLAVWPGVDQVCDPARAATVLRVGADRYRWEFRLHDGETVEDLACGDQLGPLLARWTGTTNADRLTVVRAAEYRFVAALADCWARDHVFLLGDAAHLTPPFIGQGLGAGLRDAANLAWKVAAARDGGDSGLLATYEPERRPAARRMIRMAVLAGWAMTGGQDRAATLRRAVLAVACGVPGFSPAALRATVVPLGRSPLVRRSWRRRLPGTALPQPRVATPEGPTRLDDVLGRWFAVVALGPVPAGLAEVARERGATVVVVRDPARPHRGSAGVTDLDGSLVRWFRRHAVAAVVVRPDRVVHAAARAGPGSRRRVTALAADPLWAWLPRVPAVVPAPPDGVPVRADRTLWEPRGMPSTGSAATTVSTTSTASTTSTTERVETLGRAQTLGRADGTPVNRLRRWRSLVPALAAPPTRPGGTGG